MLVPRESTCLRHSKSSSTSQRPSIPAPAFGFANMMHSYSVTVFVTQVVSDSMSECPVKRTNGNPMNISESGSTLAFFDRLAYFCMFPPLSLFRPAKILLRGELMLCQRGQNLYYLCARSYDTKVGSRTDQLSFSYDKCVNL